MKEQLITFETAKLAKDKGFDWETRYLFDPTFDNKAVGAAGFLNWNKDEYDRETSEMRTSKRTSAPSQTILQEWLRKEHGIDLWSQPFTCNNESDGTYSYFLYKSMHFNGDGIDFKSYEEALEEGLQQALELI